MPLALPKSRTRATTEDAHRLSQQLRAAKGRIGDWKQRYDTTRNGWSALSNGCIGFTRKSKGGFLLLVPSKISQSLVNNFRLGSRSTLCRIRQCGRRCAREGTYPKRPKIATRSRVVFALVSAGAATVVTTALTSDAAMARAVR